MGVSKRSTLTLRIERFLKEALRIAADKDHRSIANLVEVLIRDRTGCARRQIRLPERAAGLSWRIPEGRC